MQAKQLEEMVTVDTARFREVVKTTILKNRDGIRRNLCVEGPPGSGKSQIIGSVTAELGCNLYDIRSVEITDSGDIIMKIPNPDHTAIIEIPFSRLPKDEKGVIFLDEFRQASDDVRRCFYRMIHDRSVGPYELPKDVTIIIASNTSEDVNTPELEGPLFDRFSYRVNLMPDLKAWKLHTAGMPNAALVHGFLGAFPDNFQVRPKHGRALMTPRRWVTVMEELPDLKNVELTMHPSLFSGFSEFVEKVEMFKDVPAYIEGKKRCPDDMGDQWAVYTAIIAHMQNAKDVESVAFSIMEEKMEGMDPDIQANTVFESIRGLMAKKGYKSPVEVALKCKPAQQAIFQNVCKKYAYIAAGMKSS